MPHKLAKHTGILVGFLTLIYVIFLLLPPIPVLRNIDSFLPLHSIVETFSVVVSSMIFGIIWNTCDTSRARNILILGAGFLAVGLLDFAHLLSYKGMPDFVTPSSEQKGIVFWLAARLVAASAMFVAAISVWKPLTLAIDRNRLLALILAFTVLVYWLELFHPDWFPVFWEEGKGLTLSKIVIEYLAIALYLASAILFYRLSSQRSDIDFDYCGLFPAACVMAISELCFTSYSSVSDAFNLLGHLYKIIAYLFLYKTLFLQLVHEPYHQLERSRHDIWLEKERAEITLQSIMDGVITTNAKGNVVSMNPVASQLTGWSNEAAQGRALSRVFSVFDENDLSPIENPVEQCLRERRAVLLSNHAMIVSSFGIRYSIEQLASPIINKSGDIIGVVMVFRDVSERRQTLLELSRREQSLSEAQAIAHLGNWEWDIASNQITWSDELYRIFGFPPNSITPTYETFLSLLHPEDLYKVVEAVDQTLNNIKTYDVEYRVVHPDGNVRHAHALGEVQRDQRGKPEKMIGTVLDITERKLAEDMLRNSKAEIEDLYDHAPCGYHSLDSNGIFRRINQTELNWLGYSREEMIGKMHITDVFSEESAKRFNENYQRFKLEGAAHDLEFEMVRKDGSSFFVSLNATAIYDPEGHFLASRSTIADISERRRQAQFQTAILDALPANLALLDSNGFIIAVNQRWKDFARDNGLQDNRAGIGTNYLEACDNFSSRENTAMATASGLRSILAGEACQYAVEYPCHTSSQQRWFRMLAVPLSSSERLGAVVVHIDITESWQHKSEIEALNQQLEQRVTERTSQLEAANKELEAFSYSVSHDLRAPLRIIDGFAQILAADYSTAMPEAARKHLDRILHATMRMAELIDDMLQLSYISREQLNFKTVNLSLIAENILQEFKQSNPDRKVKLRIAPDLYVQGDAQLMKIALENLLGNAWKFSRNKPMTEIEFGALHDGKQTIYYVRDNGEGFNQKYAHKLFGAFQRLHSEDEFEGTGIGLATVQRIISRHGGTIWAESKLGEGAVFFFTV